MSNGARPDPLAALRAIPDAHERLMWLTELGRRPYSLSPDERVPANRVPGCVSPVWLVDDSSGGICRFRADAEAPVLRGLVTLVCDCVNERPAAEVAASPLDLVTALELGRHLSATRTHGLRAFQAHIQSRARLHAAAPPP